MKKLKRNIFLGLKDFFWGKKNFPSNIIVTAAHGSYKIPLSIFPKLSSYYKTSPRLLLNFSDYGTKYLIETVPSDQKVIPKYGRLIGDANRSKDSDELIRFKDFGGNRIFSEKFEKRLTTSWFHTFWLNKILKLSYKPFYEEVFQAIKLATENKENDGKPIFLIDVHDTGNLILGTTKKSDRKRKGLFQMPKVVISSAPDEQVDKDCFGTAPDYLTEIFQENLAKKLGLELNEVKINHLFYGGNVIRFFGNPSKNNRLKKILGDRKIYTVQIEFNRGLYMKEESQRPIKWKVKSIRCALTETLRELESSIINVEK